MMGMADRSLGPYANTLSRAPTGPKSRPSGNPGVGLKGLPKTVQQFGVPSGTDFQQGPSKYAADPRQSPSPWINDVDMESIWYCYDDQTQILTAKRGWQHFVDLVDDDLVATMDPITKCFQWQQPKARPVLDYIGNLIHFTAEGIDALVTPNHNMVVNYLPYKACELLGVPKQQGEGTYLIPAEILEKTVNHHVKVPVVAKHWLAHDLPDMLVPSEKHGDYSITIKGLDYCAFLGLFLSEGSCGNGQVRIWQAREGDRWERVALILEKAFGDRVSYIDHLGLRRDPGYFIIYSSALVAHLKQFGYDAETKQIPLAVRNASKNCLMAFLSAYMLGDGEYSLDNKKTNYREMRLPPTEIRGRITTISPQIADALQEIAVKLGYSARIEVLDRQETYWA